MVLNDDGLPQGMYYLAHPFEQPMFAQFVIFAASFTCELVVNVSAPLLQSTSQNQIAYRMNHLVRASRASVSSFFSIASCARLYHS